MNPGKNAGLFNCRKNRSDMNHGNNIIIESIGTYLPPHIVSTNEILQGCTNRIHFPLEKITGIKTRRMAGQHEFSIDLGKQAVADCLAKSKYAANDIDLLICCNISRYDDLNKVSFEPSTAIRLKQYFGFTGALSFDITNACAGMFTGIYIVNTLIKTGAIRRGMVVSGEYITCLAQTAQRDIKSFMDTRVACLTLGDGGAALILEEAADNGTGFQELDLQTFGRYSRYCTATITEHDGAVMYTDSVNLTNVGVTHAVKHSLNMLDRAKWSPEDFQHLLMHQTSTMTLNSARNEINRMLKREVCHDGNTINNLEERGNTASTAHFIALADHIRGNKIHSGDKIIFSITASGLTIGTALYVFDDLPDRLRQLEPKQVPTQNESFPKALNGAPKVVTRGIRVESVGTVATEDTSKNHAMTLLHRAATDCLENSAYTNSDIDLLIYCGVYRNDYMMEPAYATILAGEMDMNACMPVPDHKKTLAFDIFNGSVGFLNACYVAQQMIEGNTCNKAMVVAAEIENNAGLFPQELLGVRETASAIIMDLHPSPDRGFTRFLFKDNVASLSTYTTYCTLRNKKPYLCIEKEADLDALYIANIIPTVQKLLQMEQLEFSQIDKIFPPQISSSFITRLSEALDLPRDMFVDVVAEGADLFTSALPYALKHAYEQGLVKAGDTGLMIAAGSGIQVGCAIYHF